MRVRRSRRLVIDADIARACGESGTTRAAIAARFLTSVLTICHRVVITAAIRVEWDRHRSPFFTKWLSAMVRKGKDVDLHDPVNRKMRNHLRRIGLGPRKLEEALKDAHLLEAAQAADKIICSFDSTARGYFRHLCDVVDWVGEIEWVNPEDESDAVIEWLHAGARQGQYKIKTAPISRGRD